MSDAISQMDELTSAAENDEFVIVDKDDPTQSPTNGTTKRIQKQNALSGTVYTISGFEDYLVIQGSGSRNTSALTVGNIIFGTGAFYSGAIIFGTVNNAPVTQDSDITVSINLGTGS